MNKTILLTGGLGYIGSHIVIDLLNKRYKTIIIDNLSNSNIDTLEKIKSIVGEEQYALISFYNIDISVPSVEFDEVFSIFVCPRYHAEISPGSPSNSCTQPKIYKYKYSFILNNKQNIIFVN
jgi:dTDP-D-glucose 4,6-dehydratase